ncbi:MAG: hypothetical protein QXQ71_05235 [Desulfurococcaceae archaeon]
MDPWLQDRINMLSDEFKHYRSIDSYLIKLSSLIYDLEDYSYGDIQRARILLEKILTHPSIINHMAHLSCYKDTIEAQIQRDPRVRKLRDYSDVLIKVLSETPCKEEKSMELSREATFRIEKKEEEVTEEIKHKHLYSNRNLIVKISIAAGLIFVALAVFYAILILLKVH